MCMWFLLQQVDAFTDAAFGGNPASVVLIPPGSTLSDSDRLSIAAETKQSMTAFLEPVAHQGATASQQNLFQAADRFRLRWFTPSVEYRLCGHATLASAAALFQGKRRRVRCQPMHARILWLV